MPRRGVCTNLNTADRRNTEEHEVVSDKAGAPGAQENDGCMLAAEDMVNSCWSL